MNSTCIQYLLVMRGSHESGMEKRLSFDRLRRFMGDSIHGAGSVLVIP
ncbi:MAG: hypothetical protein VB104_02665 [Candidatus Limiplasma sp.]|nr:hypothetical protein [Candidatus Limiplasma sp.]